MQFCYKQSKLEFYLVSFHYADTQRSWRWWIWQTKYCWKVVLLVHVLSFFQGRPLKVHFYAFLDRKLNMLLEKSNTSPYHSVCLCYYAFWGSQRGRTVLYHMMLQFPNWKHKMVKQGVTFFLLSCCFLCISCSLPGWDANIWSCARVYPHNTAAQSTKFQRMQQIPPPPAVLELAT